MIEASPIIYELRRRRWLGRTTLKRGAIPKRPNVSFRSWSFLTILFFAVVGIVAFAIVIQIIELFAIGTLLIGCMAICRAFRTWIQSAFNGDAFDDQCFKDVHPHTLFLMGAAPIGVLTYILSHQLILVAGLSIAAGVLFRPLTHALNGKRLPPLSSVLTLRGRMMRTVTPIPTEVDITGPGTFGLWIGEGTGTLASMGHCAGIKAEANVTLDLADATKNIVIFGETGTGKTTRVITHLLIQALDFDAGAFIFDVRGDFHETVINAALLTGKTIKRIGIGQLGLNLLDGLTPNTATGILEAAFHLLGQGEGDSGFWVSLAVARVQNALSILKHTPAAYSLKGLYRYVFDQAFRETVIASTNEQLIKLQLQGSEGDANAALEVRRLKTALDYEKTVVPSYGERELSGLKRTIETALARFADPELEDAFCAENEEQVQLEDLLEGAVFVVNVPRERFKAAARVVYLFLKERFFQVLNARAQMPPGPRRERPVLFLCDEYQQIANADDANFFDTSRALGVIGIIAAQSLDAFLNTLGNEHTAMTLLGNFANIIAFRSTPRTIEYLTAKLGNVDVWKVTHSGGQTKVSDFIFGQISTNDGRSTTQERQAVLDAQLLRTLSPDHAVALLTVRGSAFDDVIRVPQIITVATQ